MPIYEYTCRKCNAHVEALQKTSDKPLTRCKKCGGKLEKQWSTSGIQFKGAGWYVTDYANKKTESKEATETKGEAQPAKADAKPAGKAESKSEAKAEAKPETKASEDKKKSSAATSNAKGD